MVKVVGRILSISFTVLVCILVVCGLYRIGQDCYGFGYRVYTEPAMTEGRGKDMLVQITEDMETKELAEVLQEKELVRDSRLFFLQAKLAKYEMVPGIYTVNTSMTPRELMAAMTPEESEEAEEEADK